MENKNMLRITFALIAGVVLGYMLATSGINNRDQAARGINADLSIGTSKGAVKPNPQVVSLYNFIEPNNSSIWQIGSSPNIEWDMPLPYAFDCSKTKFYLIDLATNTPVGQIWPGMTSPTSTYFTWDSTFVYTSPTICGGPNITKILVNLTPSKYKIRVEQSDVNNPANPTIIFTSSSFTLN